MLEYYLTNYSTTSETEMTAEHSYFITLPNIREKRYFLKLVNKPQVISNLACL